MTGTDVLALFASLALMALLVTVLWTGLEAVKRWLVRRWGGEDGWYRTPII